MDLELIDQLLHLDTVGQQHRHGHKRPQMARYAGRQVHRGKQSGAKAANHDAVDERNRCIGRGNDGGEREP
ncbi:hypothetical protein D3C83_295650 [compost metagenome]